MKESRKGSTIIGAAARSVALTDALLRSAAHSTMQFSGAKPPRTTIPSAISDAAILAEMLAVTEDRFSGPNPRSTAPIGAHLRSGAHKNSSFEKAKPNSPQPIELPPICLTTRQLAAARLVVQGLRSSEVAVRIGTITQTINRWKHLPAFAVEVRRLHELLAVSTTGDE